MTNYAVEWSEELLQIIDDGAYSSPFLAPAEKVKWMGKKTFVFARLFTGGFKPHNRAGGWNAGVVDNEEKPMTIEHDRDIEFFVDAADIDETKQTANIENVSKTFTATQATPEVDARFFEKVCAAAVKDGFYSTSTGWTNANAYGRLVKILQAKNLKKYRAMGGLIAYVSSAIMDCLESSTEVQKTLSIKSEVLNEKQGIETRIATINGVTIIEVVDDSRFYSAFDYSDGFAGTGTPINVLVAHPSMVKTVVKFEDIFFFAKGQHTKGDGDLYQNRTYWDTFVFPNGANGDCDAVYVDLNADDPTVRNWLDKTLKYKGYSFNATGTDVELADGASASVDYIIKGTGKAAKVPTGAGTAIWGDADITNAWVFLVELADGDAYYGRGASKVTSGMVAIPSEDIITVGNQKFLLLVKGFKDGDIVGGDFFSVGSAAGTVTKAYKLDDSALKLA